MPRDYRPVQSYRSGGSGYTSAARAGSAKGDLSDALLLGSAHTRNPDPFTAEVRAAYAAFCGITEEIVARRLWRSFVTWDDLNDYVAAGISPDDYTTMTTLRSNGIAPEQWGDWRTHFPDLYDQSLLRLVQEMGPLHADPETRALWDRLRNARRISGRISGAFSNWSSRNYGGFLSSFRGYCQDKDVNYPQAAMVAEALLLADERNSFTKKSQPKPAGWVDLLQRGMSPARAAVLIYAGAVQPNEAKNWTDRSTRTVLGFAALTVDIPCKVQEAVAHEDAVEVTAS